MSRSKYVDPKHPDYIPDEEFYDGPSRSMLKREAEAQNDIVAELLKLGKAQLKKFTFFDEDFIKDVLKMKEMSFGPHYRRQRSFLAKRIRQEDWYDQIVYTLGMVHGDSKQAVAIQHRCEQWRDRLIENGDDMIGELLAVFPHADRQEFKQSIRLAKQEKEQSKPPKHSRILFQMLKALHEQQHIKDDHDENQNHHEEDVNESY
jgi:ribosome-associated protein